MILILTNTDDVGADYVIAGLRASETRYFRFNTDGFPERYEITRGYSSRASEIVVEHEGGRVDLAETSVIWYRRQLAPPSNEFFGRDNAYYVGRESRYFLEGVFLSLEVPWVNPLHVTRVAEQKLLQLQVARDCGFLVPETIVANNLSSLTEFSRTHNPLICKPIYSGLQILETSGFSVYTREMRETELEDEEDARFCPTLLQEKVDKTADLRLTMFGESAYAVRIVSPPGLLDWRRPNAELRYQVVNPSPSFLQRCRLTMKKLGLEFGAFDFAEGRNGDYWFLEVNATGEWAWLDAELELGMRSDFIAFLMSKHG